MSLDYHDVVEAMSELRGDGIQPGVLYVERESLGVFVDDENLIRAEDAGGGFPDPIDSCATSLDVRALPVGFEDARGVLCDDDHEHWEVIN